MATPPIAPWQVGLAAAVLAIGSTREARAEVDLGLGVIGAAGGNFLDKPDRTRGEADTYPGFGGPTYGGGVFVDVRFIELIGVEIDVIRSLDRGSGTVELPALDVDVTLGQSAWHVPVLAKLTIDSPLIAPMFFAGPELVFPGDPEVESNIPASVPVTLTGKAESYTMLTFGGGIEVKLPLPVIDLRLPLALRVSYNPGVPDEFHERVQPTATGARYDTEWKYAVGVTAGAGLWF